MLSVFLINAKLELLRQARSQAELGNEEQEAREARMEREVRKTRKTRKAQKPWDAQEEGLALGKRLLIE